MGKLSAIKSRLSTVIKKKSTLVAIAVVLAASVTGLAVKSVQAERPDCDSNAILYCGAYDLGTLYNKYNNDSGAQATYAASPFGISRSEFFSLSNGYKIGSVTRNNTVVVDGKVVATNAITAGNHNIGGSTKIQGAPGYYRAPSVSFKQYSLSAFVKFDAQGRFQFAVIRSCGNPVVGTPTQPAKPPFVPKPSFSVEKKVKVAYTNDQFQEKITVKTGERVEYAIAVTNTGNVDLKNMMVRDKLPNSMSYVPNSTHMITSYAGQKRLPDGVAGRGINIGTLPVKGTAYVFFKADAPKASNTNLKICETGEKSVLHNVAYAGPSTLPEKNDDADVLTCRPGKPSFSIEKKVKIAGTDDQFAENVYAKPGTLLEFAVAVKNTGDIQLKNMIVTDALPKGLTYKANTTRLVTSRGVNKTLPDSPSLFFKGVTLSVMEPQETAFLIFQAYLPKADSNDVAVKECTTGKTKLVNIAKAKPAGLNTKQDDASAETCKEVEKKPNFELQKDVRKKGETNWKQDVTVKYGDSVEYRIVVKNTGETDLKDVVVKDARPTGVNYVNGTLKVNGQASNGDLFGAGVTIPEIKLGQSAEITFEAKVEENSSDDCKSADFKNIASATPKGLETKTDDAIVKVNCVVIEKNPGVSIDKRIGNSVVIVGQPFTYTLDVKNTGDVDLKDVKVTDPAPAGVEFISSNTPSGSTTDVTAGNFNATVANLAVGQTVTFELQAKVVTEIEGVATNTACVDTTEIPGQPDDCDSVTVTTPEYECRTLNTLSLGDLKYRFSVSINRTDPVQLVGVTYNFGDGSDLVSVNNLDAVEHQYTAEDEEKTYDVTAVVEFNVGGQVKESTCTAQVKISTTPDEPCPYNPNLPKDSPDCVEQCPYNPELPANSPACYDRCPYDENLPVDSKECRPPETPEPPVTTPQPPVSVVPNTGSGSVLAGFAGTSITTYLAYLWVEGRRSLKQK